MLFTIDQINPNLSSTTGFTIGAHILDDCDKDTYGLEQAVAFIKGKLIIKRFSLRALCYPFRI
jgi:metabotropic X receptor